MTSTSRTANTSRNLVVGVVSKAFLLGTTFLVRTLFIRILGAEYTGVSSLYSNILSLLNLAELGFGSVLTYELYRPLRDNDDSAVAALVALFKRIYTVVIIIVLTIGLALVPFLKYIINSSLDERRLLIYYVLYLADSVASYFVVYRTMVIVADQKRYITNVTDISSKFVMYICQSIYLVLTHDFLGYLCIQVLFTILNNVILNQIAVHRYPYLRHLRDVQAAVPTEHVQRIYQNVKAMFITKVSNAVLNQTDSIIMSMMFGTIYVGYYSNYYAIIVYINSLIYIVIKSVEASIGDLNAENNKDKSYQIYRRINMVIRFINTFCVAEFVCLIQDFIVIWIGEQYLQGWDLILALMFTFYMQHAMEDINVYRQTLGLFKAVRRIYPIMAIINIILSIILGEIMGSAGVILATGISRMVTVFWYEGGVVYRELGHRVWDYILQQTGSLVVTTVTVGAAWLTCSFLPITGFAALLMKAIISMIIVALSYFVIYGRSEEWTWLMHLLRNQIIERGVNR